MNASYCTCFAGTSERFALVCHITKLKLSSHKWSLGPRPGTTAQRFGWEVGGRELSKEHQANFICRSRSEDCDGLEPNRCNMVELDYPAVFVAFSFSGAVQLLAEALGIVLINRESGQGQAPSAFFLTGTDWRQGPIFLQFMDVCHLLFDIRWITWIDDAYGEGFNCYCQSWSLAVALELSDCLALSAASTCKHPMFFCRCQYTSGY